MKNTPENRTSDDICFDCGRNYLTDLQLIMGGNLVTTHVSICGLCEEKKSVTSFRHFNYLRTKNMNFQELRRGLMIMGNSIDKLPGSRQLSLAKTNCEQAMMWVGTTMKFAKLGDNPYGKHDGNRNTVEDIEPMFDATSDTIDASFYEKGNIHAVDQMREYFGKQLEALVTFIDSGDEFTTEEVEYTEAEESQIAMCLMNAYTNMTQARMWLGMELGRIRDEAKS